MRRRAPDKGPLPTHTCLHPWERQQLFLEAGQQKVLHRLPSCFSALSGKMVRWSEARRATLEYQIYIYMLKAAIIISYHMNRGANGRQANMTWTLILGQLMPPETLSARHPFWIGLKLFQFAPVAPQLQCYFRHVPLLTLKGSIAFWRVFRGHCTVWILIIMMLPLPDRCQSSRHRNGTVRHLLLTPPPPHTLPAPKEEKKKRSNVGSSKCLEGIRCQLLMF